MEFGADCTDPSYLQSAPPHHSGRACGGMWRHSACGKAVHPYLGRACCCPQLPARRAHVRLDCYLRNHNQSVVPHGRHLPRRQAGGLWNPGCSCQCGSFHHVGQESRFSGATSLATIVSYLLFVMLVQTLEVRRILRGDFLPAQHRPVQQMEHSLDAAAHLAGDV